MSIISGRTAVIGIRAEGTMKNEERSNEIEIDWGGDEERKAKKDDIIKDEERKE